MAALGRRTIQTAGYRSSNEYEITVTLAVHPRYGEKLLIVSTYGRHAVRAQTGDGKTVLIPVEWTTMTPRAAALRLYDKDVHLSPKALCDLANWVAAHRPQVQPLDGKKLAEHSGRSENKEHAGGYSTGPSSTITMVGQARSPNTGSRVGRQKQREK